MNKTGIILIFCLVISLSAVAQSSFYKKKIDIQASQVSYDEALSLIAEKGGFSFSYNPDLIPADSTISFDFQEATVKHILNELLGQEMEARINGNHLVILGTRYSKKIPDKDGEDFIRINGYVRNVETGENVANSTVYDVKGLRSVKTNDTGYFMLEIPSKDKFMGIAASKNTFADTSVVIYNKAQQLIIPVRPEIVEVDSTKQSTSRSRGINSLSIVRLFTPSSGLARSGTMPITNYRKGQISFLPFVGSNLMMSGSVSNKYSLNILAGYSAEVRGIEAGGLVNMVRFDLTGLQFAGLINLVGTATYGVQIAGLFNTTLGKVKGFQLAGISNVVLDSLQGVQLAGINNTTTGNMNGFQLAGINNLSLKNVDGMQLAGITNIALKNVNSLQFAGILNASLQRVHGAQFAGILNYAKVSKLQLAGIMNVSLDSVKGAQLAGVVNFTRHNAGLQFGLINIADTVSGVSVGILNFIFKGYNKVELHSNEALPFSARLKFGSQRFYNILGFGVNTFTSEHVWGYSYGIGSAFSVGQRGNTLNLDVTATNIQAIPEWYDDLHLNGRIQIQFAGRLSRHLMIFAGPVWSTLYYKNDDLHADMYLDEIVPYVLNETTWNDHVVKSWIGFDAGLRFF